MTQFEHHLHMSLFPFIRNYYKLDVMCRVIVGPIDLPEFRHIGKVNGYFKRDHDHPAIYIEDSNFDQQVRFLFHEVTHYKQFLDGRLRSLAYNSVDEYYNSENETEAREQEVKMGKAYKKFMVRNYDRHYIEG